MNDRIEIDACFNESAQRDVSERQSNQEYAERPVKSPPRANEVDDTEGYHPEVEKKREEVPERQGRSEHEVTQQIEQAVNLHWNYGPPARRSTTDATSSRCDQVGVKARAKPGSEGSASGSSARGAFAA